MIDHPFNNDSTPAERRRERNASTFLEFTHDDAGAEIVVKMSNERRAHVVQRIAIGG
jgi:hypothetical protein